jgi:hypothetical protein
MKHKRLPHALRGIAVEIIDDPIRANIPQSGYTRDIRLYGITGSGSIRLGFTVFTKRPGSMWTPSGITVTLCVGRDGYERKTGYGRKANRCDISSSAMKARLHQRKNPCRSQPPYGF